MEEEVHAITIKTVYAPDRNVAVGRLSTSSTASNADSLAFARVP